MRGTRFRCAGAILVGGNEPRNDRFKDIGLGSGERFERFTLGRGRDHHTPWCCALLSGRRSRRCQWRARKGCNACRTNLFEHAAPRDIAWRRVVTVVCHGVLPADKLPEAIPAIIGVRDAVNPMKLRNPFCPRSVPRSSFWRNTHSDFRSR